MSFFLLHFLTTALVSCLLPSLSSCSPPPFLTCDGEQVLPSNCLVEAPEKTINSGLSESDVEGSFLPETDALTNMLWHLLPLLVFMVY